MIRRLVLPCLALSFATVLRLAAAAPDFSAYDALLHDHVRAGQVDYAALKTDARLADTVAAIAATDPAALTDRDARLAFWLNAYNALTLKLVADHFPVISIRDIAGGKPWDQPVVKLADGRALTLNQIENDIVRPEFKEPRVHFALVCAAVSCPPLRSEAYVAGRLNAQLDDQAKTFVNDVFKNRLGTHSLRLSAIFQWFAADFGGSEAAMVRFITPWMPKAPAPDATVSYLEYDWKLNGLRD